MFLCFVVTYSLLLVACVQSASYEEKVVKPREEEKLKRAEEELKSVSKHWKLGGHKLGRLDDESEHLDVTEQDVPLLESEEDEPTHQLRFRGVKRSDSQEAAGRRRLNVSQDLLSQSSLSSSPQKDSSRGGDVCEGGEAGEDGDGVVTIAMKLPNQQVVQKKFSQVAKISVCPFLSEMLYSLICLWYMLRTYLPRVLQ